MAKIRKKIENLKTKNLGKIQKAFKYKKARRPKRKQITLKSTLLVLKWAIKVMRS